MWLRDPFEQRCPKAAELTAAELASLVGIHEDIDVLTGWEHQFCESIVRQLWYGRGLSLRQMEVLDKGIIAKCWRNDPSLWEEIVDHLPLAHVVPNPSLRARYQTQRRMIERFQFLRLDETDLLEGLEWIEKLMDAGSTVPPF